MKNYFLLLPLAFALTGCLVTRSELNEQEEQKQVQSQITEIRQAKAEQEFKAQSYENEMRNMLGRIEILEKRVGEKQQSETAGQAESAKQLKDLVDQMKIFEESLNSMNQRLEKLEKATKAETEEAKTSAASVTTDKKKSSWDKAEDLFNKKDWKNAALGFQQYVDLNPKGTNMPMALYKIGVCFQELKMKDEAKSFFEEAISKFPNSSAARKAKYRMNQIK